VSSISGAHSKTLKDQGVFTIEVKVYAFLFLNNSTHMHKGNRWRKTKQEGNVTGREENSPSEIPDKK